jgi:hypothetical protein
VVYEQTADWEKRQGAVYAGILAEQASLWEELGELVASLLFDEAANEPARLRLVSARRVLVVARKV